MISKLTVDMLEKLQLPYPAVALKYHVCEPKNIEHYQGEKLAFCQFLKYAQEHEKAFFVNKNDDACYGKMALGMIPKPPVTASGQAGEDFEVYASNSGCRKLYQELPVIEPGTVNYVQFSRVSACDFDPDLIMIVANLEKAEILMRANTYLTGDFWESKSSPVLSCSWMYAYPVISGKINHITTGYYHGLKRRKAYPAGLEMIAIPFQKIDIITLALQRMPWTTIAFREDEESRQELQRRMDNWQNMAKELNSTVDLH